MGSAARQPIRRRRGGKQKPSRERERVGARPSGRGEQKPDRGSRASGATAPGSDRGALFLAELETWLGTPFEPQQSAKGRGCDCKGLISGAMRELGFPEADSLYATSTGYRLDRSNGIPGATLKRGMEELFDLVEAPAGTNVANLSLPELAGLLRPGDLLLCKWGGQPAHLAAYAGPDANGREQAIHTQIKSKAYVKRTELRVLLFYYPLDSVWRLR